MTWFYAEVRLRHPACPVAAQPEAPDGFRCLDPGSGGSPLGVVEAGTPGTWVRLGRGPDGPLVRAEPLDCEPCPLVDGCGPAAQAGPEGGAEGEPGAEGGTNEILTHVHAADGALDVGICTDDRADLRSLVQVLREREQDPVVRRIETADRPPGASEGLTGRQREVLEAATEAGYFSAGDAVTLEEVARRAGGSKSTVHEHLQKGLTRILEARFG